MCESLAEIRQALLRFTGSLDATRFTPAAASRLLADAAVIERTAAAVTVQFAARAAQTQTWQTDGDPTPAHQLARQTGLSVEAARQRLQTGRRLAEQPEIAAAANAGQLSTTQLAAVSEAADHDPTAAARLVQVANTRSVGELQEECRRTRAAADRDPEARRARIHANRSLRHFTDSAGVGHLQLMHTPETIAELMAAISPTRERLFHSARKDGRRERSDALDADALVACVRAATTGSDAKPGGTRAKVQVRVDFDALLRGYPIEGEVCEIAGYGPVAVSAVTDLIATGNAVLVAIATKGEKVTGVAHLGRHPTAAQTSALEWLHPTCAVEGCNRTNGLERDHRTPWADSKITLLEELDRLCRHHHDLKSHKGWALVPGTGKRPFVPATDPRHPQHASASERPRPPPNKAA